MTEPVVTIGCPHAHEDAAYVLGALSPEDRIAFERHLPTCPDCAASVRELAGIPGLLARVPVEILDPDQAPPVPETLLPALVRSVRRTQRRRTWLTAGLVGVAAAATVAAIAFATVGDDESPPTAGSSATPTASEPSAAPSTAPPELMSPVGDSPISGWVSLTPVGWGTRLDLECTYAEQDSDYSEPSWSTYTMLVRTADGTVEQVASWKALPGRTMRISGSTSADRDDIVSVEVRTAAGEPVLELS